MLKSLSIRNVVLIDKLDLDFQSGFSVLSGETGAGKSILLVSVGLLLGRRAETGMIRTGCDKLAVVGIFEVNKNSELAKICADYDIDFASEIIIKRTLDTEGHSKVFFNGEPVTLKFLKEISGCLVEIHGQFDNQGLLNSATHRAVLDSYGDYGDDVAAMKDAYEGYKTAKTEYNVALEEYEEAQKDEENLRHWVEELIKLSPKENEVAELEDKRRQMMNAEKILENLSVAESALNGNAHSVRESLRQAQAAVARVNNMLNDKFAGLFEVLDTALINVEEGEEEINAALNEINLNSGDIDIVEERLFKLKSIARKHQTTPEDLPRVWRDMEEKLKHLEKGGSDLQKLQKARDEAWSKYIKVAQKVSQERKATALLLDGRIMAELPDLKMEKARFMTQISSKPENIWNENGIDDICFMVTTNPGQPFGPLSKIASGGELARFMLAIKVNLAQTSEAETMIFDEVDTGIGGATAQAVGEKLAKLGKNVQVLVVTHSPQVAAQSEHHFKVEKHTIDNITTTTLRQLSNSEKREEIARMLSGEQISDEARAAAKVLIGA